MERRVGRVGLSHEYKLDALVCFQVIIQFLIYYFTNAKSGISSLYFLFGSFRQ